LDHLDGLTERLVGDLDRRADLPLESCPGLPLLEQLAAGRLNPRAREPVDRHLHDCLTYLNRFIELRDFLEGVGRRWGARIIDTLRRALIFRVPAEAEGVYFAVAVQHVRELLPR
jgi:hypothetical protein